MPAHTAEATRNVLISTALIAGVVVVISLVLLAYLTGDDYLSAYYALEIFFLASNSFAAATLSQLAISKGATTFAEIMAIQIVDNLSRLLIISFIVAAVVDMVAYANVENLISRFKIRGMRGHIIICSSSDISTYIIERLAGLGKPFLVIEGDRERALELSREQRLVLTGSFTDEKILSDAGIDRAYAIVFTSKSDIDNLLGTITARHMSKGVKIVARATTDEVRRKLLRAGADMSVLPEYLAGLEIGDRVVEVMTR